MSIPRDNYIGEPNYPAPWTTKQPLEGLRDVDEARIVSLSPDVCLTPVGSSVVPIPYPVVDYCGHDRSYTPSVRFTGQKAMVMRSCTTHVHGDAPGTRKGVKSGTVESICEPIGHAAQVRAEGSNVIRHLDRFWMNNKNTQGEAIFVRSTQTYDPPIDTDPVSGSLQSQQRPIQLAFDASSPEGQQLLKQFMADALKEAPQIPKPPVSSSGAVSALERLGTFGKLFGKIAGPLTIITSGGTPDLDNAILANHAAEAELKNIHPMGAAENALYDQTKKRIADHIYDAYGNPFAGPDEDYIAKERSYLETVLKIERSKKLEMAMKQGVRVDTSDKDEWPCVVGPYKYVNMVCPGEAHHIIPDMVYRLGSAPNSEAEKNSTEGRIPNSPTYNEGQAICLSEGMHRTDDDAVHASLNPALTALGKTYNPQGTAPLGKIRDEAHKALDQVESLPEKCRKMAKQAADMQVAGKREQPGRTTMRPPKMPQNEDVIKVLKAGKYPQ